MKQKEIPQDISSLLCPIVEGQYKCEQQAPGFSLDSGAVSVVSKESNHILLNFIKEFYKQINELYEKLTHKSSDEIKEFEQKHLAEYFCKLIDELNKKRNAQWEEIKNKSTNIFPRELSKEKEENRKFCPPPQDTVPRWRQRAKAAMTTVPQDTVPRWKQRARAAMSTVPQDTVPNWRQRAKATMTTAQQK